MKRTAGSLLLLATLAGCVTTEDGGGSAAPWAGGGAGGGAVSMGSCPGNGAPPAVPGVQGPWGQPVAMQAPYTASPPVGAQAARSMLANSVPLDLVQQVSFNTPAGPLAGLSPAGGGGPLPGAVPPPGGLTPPGVPAMPGLAQAGHFPPGAVASVGALTGGGRAPYPVMRTSVRFAGPSGMTVSWYAPGAGGKNGFSTSSIEVPGRYNFIQAAIYRLKLSDVPGRPGLQLYPTLEVVPGNAKTAAFLAHSAVPLTFTEDDFEQVAAGNYVVKVIYLPDPQFQDLATTGPDVLVSSQLEPGVDPIAQAQGRGSILLVVRLGNIDLEAPNTPAMDAPNPYAPGMMGPCPPPMMPGQAMGSPPAGPAGATPPGRFIMGPQGAPVLTPKAPTGMPAIGKPPAAQPDAPPVNPQQGLRPSNPPARLPDPTAVQHPPAKMSLTPAGLAGQGSAATPLPTTGTGPDLRK